MVGSAAGNFKELVRRFREALWGAAEDYIYWYAPCILVLYPLLCRIDYFVLSNDSASCLRHRLVAVFLGTWAWAWFLQGSYYWLDTLPRLRKYKITLGDRAAKLHQDFQLPDRRAWVERLHFNDIVLNCIRNQLIYFGLGTLVVVKLANRLAIVWSPQWERANDVPGIVRVLFEVAPLFVFFDFLLGFAHHLLHTPRFYKYHKDHHQTKADSPLSSWYMTFVDLMLELWIPIFLPPLLMGVSWLSFWIWLILVEFDGVHSHAAFDFGFPLPSPTRHWLHHHLLTSNYSNGLLDAIWDTEAKKRPPPVLETSPAFPALPVLLGRKTVLSRDKLGHVKVVEKANE